MSKETQLPLGFPLAVIQVRRECTTVPLAEEIRTVGLS